MKYEFLVDDVEVTKHLDSDDDPLVVVRAARREHLRDPAPFGLEINFYFYSQEEAIPAGFKKGKKISVEITD